MICNSSSCVVWSIMRATGALWGLYTAGQAGGVCYCGGREGHEDASLSAAFVAGDGPVANTHMSLFSCCCCCCCCFVTLQT
jgi:hypothetical protein